MANAISCKKTFYSTCKNIQFQNILESHRRGPTYIDFLKFCNGNNLSVWDKKIILVDRQPENGQWNKLQGNILFYLQKQSNLRKFFKWTIFVATKQNSQVAKSSKKYVSSSTFQIVHTYLGIHKFKPNIAGTFQNFVITIFVAKSIYEMC